LPISPSARNRCPTHSPEHSPIKPGRQADRTRSQASSTRRSGDLRSTAGQMLRAMIGGKVDSLPLNAAVAAALEPFGLQPRGWLAPDGSSAPRLKNGTVSKAICLVGHGGGECWPVFRTWHEMHPGITDPLDAWSKAVIEPIATLLDGGAVFPSDRPWHPFQQWAMAAEGLQPSPLGLLIHPEYGLWHGYRGAILFDDAGGLAGEGATAKSAIEAAVIHPCDTCTGRPCLSACPVEAFSPAGFAVSSCRDHLKSDKGQEGCMKSGCLARDACPVGRTYRYGAEQIRFHMAAYS
jgi:hypothetical protein